MLTLYECKFIAARSKIWTGSNVWGWDGKACLSLYQVFKQPRFG